MGHSRFLFHFGRISDHVVRDLCLLQEQIKIISNQKPERWWERLLKLVDFSTSKQWCNMNWQDKMDPSCFELPEDATSEENATMARRNYSQRKHPATSDAQICRGLADENETYKNCTTTVSRSLIKLSRLTRRQTRQVSQFK